MDVITDNQKSSIAPPPLFQSRAIKIVGLEVVFFTDPPPTILIIGQQLRLWQDCTFAQAGAFTTPLCLNLRVHTKKLIFQPKHILWLLKRTFSMRQFFWAPKMYVKNNGTENIYNWTLKNFVYLNLCQTHKLTHIINDENIDAHSVYLLIVE